MVLAVINTRAKDRYVVCHASAEDIDGVEDLRIKMCIQRNAEDFKVVHHELGRSRAANG
jgi:peptidyl-dipeptidase A